MLLWRRGPAPVTLPPMNNRFHERGGWWVVGQFALMLGVVAITLVWRHQWASTFTTVLAWGLLVCAASLGIAGKLALGANLTPFPEPRPGGVLIRSGVYGVVRHPLYAAVWMGAVGWALVWASGAGLGLALALGLFLKAKADREERFLRERFPEYADYARHVRQLIPWIY
jgi:protein-S-isoprenylcysteine O-methyltransferase Ste14